MRLGIWQGLYVLLMLGMVILMIPVMNSLNDFTDSLEEPTSDYTLATRELQAAKNIIGSTYQPDEETCQRVQHLLENFDGITQVQDKAQESMLSYIIKWQLANCQ